MNFKSFVVRTMAVFALVIALLLHATPSMAAETEKSYTNKELKMILERLMTIK